MYSRGGKLLLAPLHYTSQKCSNCGYVSRKNRKNQMRFKCCDCGSEGNADLWITFFSPFYPVPQTQ
ncbi:MAG: transposase [Holosporaceae bacterium]|nr:transposase [Holosporaceae bacterium]